MLHPKSKRVYFRPSVSALRAQSLGLNEQSALEVNLCLHVGQELGVKRGVRLLNLLDGVTNRKQMLYSKCKNAGCIDCM